MIERSAQLVREDRERFSFTMFVHQLLMVSLGGLIALEKELGRFAKGPAEMGVADLFTGMAHLLAV